MLDGTLLWHTMDVMPLFRALKGKKYQLPVVSFDFQYVNVLVALSSLIIFNDDVNFIKL